MAVVTISSSPTMLQCRICDIICSFRYVTILTIFQVPREELHPRLFPIRLVLRGAGQRREGGAGEGEHLQRQLGHPSSLSTSEEVPPSRGRQVDILLLPMP